MSGQRRVQGRDSNEAFRVVVTGKGEHIQRTEFFGPYATLAAAKGQRKILGMHEVETVDPVTGRYSYPKVEREDQTTTVERISGKWKPVEAVSAAADATEALLTEAHEKGLETKELLSALSEHADFGEDAFADVVYNLCWIHDELSTALRAAVA